MTGSFDVWSLPTLAAGLVFRPDVWTTWGIPLAAFAAGWGLSRLIRPQAPAECPTDGQPVIPSYRAVHDAFARELDRVRRYDRALAVLVLKLEDLRTAEGSMDLLPSNGSAPSGEQEALLRATRHVMFWNVGYALRDILRDSDVAACDVPNRRYVVLLPESGEDLANLAAQRIEQRIHEAIGVHVRKGIAVYRSDGLTVGDLVQAATSACDRAAASRPEVPRTARGLRLRSPRLSGPRS